MDRRPISTRDTNLARKSAKFLANLNIKPNHISILSVFFGLLAGISFYYFGKDQSIYLLFTWALFIQLRLICNLLDWMVAVEHNKKTPTWDLYNDVPDRFADFFILVWVWYASIGILWVELWYITAWLAIMCAYIRLLGASLWTPNYFVWPMAKQHRMAIITIWAILEIINFYFWVLNWFSVLYICLIIIWIWEMITIFNRLNLISKFLNHKK